MEVALGAGTRYYSASGDVAMSTSLCNSDLTVSYTTGRLMHIVYMSSDTCTVYSVRGCQLFKVETTGFRKPRTLECVGVNPRNLLRHKIHVPWRLYRCYLLLYTCMKLGYC